MYTYVLMTPTTMEYQVAICAVFCGCGGCGVHVRSASKLSKCARTPRTVHTHLAYSQARPSLAHARTGRPSAPLLNTCYARIVGRALPSMSGCRTTAAMACSTLSTLTSWRRRAVRGRCGTTWQPSTAPIHSTCCWAAVTTFTWTRTRCGVFRNLKRSCTA